MESLGYEFYSQYYSLMTVPLDNLLKPLREICFLFYKTASLIASSLRMKLVNAFQCLAQSLACNKRSVRDGCIMTSVVTQLKKKLN